MEPSLRPVHIAAFNAALLPTRETLIEGVLKRGSRIQIAATSKGFKTWLLIALAISLSTGKNWLRLKCTKCKVLYINFELYEDTIRERFREIAAAIKVDLDKANLHILNRRTKRNRLATFFENLKATLKDAEDSGVPFDVVILDPIYMLYDKGMQENDAGAVKELLDTISDCLEVRAHPVTGAWSHHYAKGDQSKKFAKERSSGSSTYQRYPDALINFTEHQNNESLVVSFSLREFPPKEEFAVSWHYPVMKVNDTLNVADVKKAPGAPEKIRPSDFLALINGDWMPRKELLAASIRKIGCCERTFDNKIKALEDLGEIERKDGNIRRIPSFEIEPIQA